MKNSLRASWQRYDILFSSRPARERVLALVVAAILVAMAGDRLLIRPLQQRMGAVQSRIDTAHLPVAAPTPAQQAEATRKQRAELQSRLDAANAAMARLEQDLVPPREMRKVLDELTAASPGVRLTRLRNLAAAPLRQNPDLRTAATAAPAADVLYRQGFEITLQGSFTDLLQYMVRLESQPRKLYWRRVELDASDYPNLSLVITVNTISQDATLLVL